MPFLILLLVCAIASMAQNLPPGIEQRVELAPILGAASQFGEAAMAVTPTGEVYLAGRVNTVPDDVTATHSAGQLGDYNILVVKMDSALDRVIYKVVIGGSERESLRSIAVADSGELYLIGVTDSDDFPSTVDLALPPSQSGRQSFVMKLNAAGDKILYGALLGDGVEPWEIAVDAAGGAYLAGTASKSALPTTPGILAPFPRQRSDGFLARVDPTGRAFDFATALDLDGVNDLLLLPDGRILLAGGGAMRIVDRSASHDLFWRTTDISRPSVAVDDAGNLYFAGGLNEYHYPSMLRVRKFSPDGSELLFDSTIPGSGNYAAVLTDARRMHLFHTLATNSPMLHTTQPCAAVLRPPHGYLGQRSDHGVSDGAHSVIAPSGERLYGAFNPQGEAAVLSPIDGTILAFRRIYRWGADGRYPRTDVELVRIDPAFVATEHPAIGCIGHGADYEPGPLSPGALMVLYGSGLGPEEGAVYGSGAEPAPLSLAGTTVTVDGEPAPVVYASDHQVNFLTPWQVRTDGAIVQVCILRNGQETCVDDATAPLEPRILTTIEPPVPTWVPFPRTLVWNENGTRNSPESPASRGSIVTMYVIGAGTPEGQLEDGEFHGAGVVPLTAQVSAFLETFDCKFCPTRLIDAEIVDAGSAPYHLLGITRVRFRVPSERGHGGLQLQFIIGDQTYAASGHVSVQ